MAGSWRTASPVEAEIELIERSEEWTPVEPCEMPGPAGSVKCGSISSALSLWKQCIRPYARSQEDPRHVDPISIETWTVDVACQVCRRRTAVSAHGVHLFRIVWWLRSLAVNGVGDISISSRLETSVAGSTIGETSLESLMSPVSKIPGAPTNTSGNTFSKQIPRS